jgi:two-component system response regulator RegX3
MNTHILIVEDDPFLTRLLTFLLADGGYETATLADPRKVEDFLAKNAVDLILLDVMLPHIDGFALCTALRRKHGAIPIIFLSARGEVRDKVDGFDHGADDYISKPFEPTEVLARIEAVLRRYRRSKRDAGTVVKVGDAALDVGQLLFTAPAHPSALLTPTEMKILECLMRNANAVISRETLITRTWGYDDTGIGNRVDVYIRRLRKKIEADADAPTFIHTVRGVGYVFHAPSQQHGGDATRTAA